MTGDTDRARACGADLSASRDLHAELIAHAIVDVRRIATVAPAADDDDAAVRGLHRAAIDIDTNEVARLGGAGISSERGGAR